MNAAQAAMLNEDWSKVTTWDVTDATGALVTTLAGLAEVLDLERADAAQELLASPSRVAAPAELVAEAEAELDPAAGDTVSLFDDFGLSPVEVARTEAETGDVPHADLDDDEDDDALEGKAFPWQKKKGDDDDTGKGTRKATIAAGAFVSGNFGKGKVDMVVDNGGKVPGVDTEVTGTKSQPAARVTVYEESDGKWKASKKKVAVRTSGLKTIPPLGAAAFGKKSGAAALVLLVADATTAVPGLEAKSIREAYDRGARSYPGEQKTALDRQAWALGRAQAFVTKASGGEVPGYVGDDDLLPR